MNKLPEANKTTDGKFRDNVVKFVLPLLMLVLVSAVVFLSNQNTGYKGDIRLLKETLANTQSTSEQHQQNAKDAKNISQKNQDYIRCLFDSFVVYTQNEEPIKVADLDKCVVVEQNTPNTEPEPTPVDNQPQSNPAETPPSSITPVNNPQQPQQPNNPDPPQPPDEGLIPDNIPIIGDLL